MQTRGAVPSRAKGASTRPATRSERRGAEAKGHVTRILGVQRSAGNRAVSAVLAASAWKGGKDSLRTTGRPLPESIRTQMEPSFRHDLSHVRLHTDPVAAASAEAVHARAYAVGRDIVFARGRFQPESPSGKRLLAHELAHVIQQERGGGTPPLDPDARHEREADAVAKAVASGSTAHVTESTGVGLARSVDDWLISTPNIRDERQWPFTALLSEIDEIEQWLSTQISSTPESSRRVILESCGTDVS
jgi:hypothetical protein